VSSRNRDIGLVLTLLGCLVLPFLSPRPALAVRGLDTATVSLAATISPSHPASAASASVAPVPAAPAPLVRGVLFFSPTCPHCEAVIEDHLPGIFERFGGQPDTAIDPSVDPAEAAFYLVSNGTLQLLLVDVSVETGARIFAADSQRLGLSPGVPRLDIADRQLIGEVDIPTRLPGIIRAGLAGAGLDWPPVPDLAGALAPFPEAAGVATATHADGRSGVRLPTASASVWDRVSRDLVANLIAIVVLGLLVASLVAVPILGHRGRLPVPRGGWRWLVPLLACGGIAISGYLGYVETNRLDAVCGPVGDCLAVQGSEFARLFGTLPTWVLGVAGYSLILAGSFVARLVQARTAAFLLAAVAATAYVGTVFSVWLTFLEPFVIGATCMWCILSALTMLALLWLTAGDGHTALGRITGPRAASAR
jgi:uncharacterized membrane protein